MFRLPFYGSAHSYFITFLAFLLFFDSIRLCARCVRETLKRKFELDALYWIMTFLLVLLRLILRTHAPWPVRGESARIFIIYFLVCFITYTGRFSVLLWTERKTKWFAKGTRSIVRHSRLTTTSPKSCVSLLRGQWSAYTAKDREREGESCPMVTLASC